jgi:hypothetical protein
LGLPVDEGDQDVGRLQVPVDDRLLVRVLDAVAHLGQELEPLGGREPMPVAVLGDREPLHVLHHEVRPALGGSPGIEHLGDGRVVHHRQGLALGLEAGDHLLGVHARLDDLQRDPAPNRLDLLGEPDLPHPALAEAVEESVTIEEPGRSIRDDIRRRAGGERLVGAERRVAHDLSGRRREETGAHEESRAAPAIGLRVDALPAVWIRYPSRS